MIYFLQNAEGHIKIGCTSNLEQRIQALQVGNSSNLKLLYIIELPDEESYSFEQHTHGFCRMYHLQGEWFKPEVLEHLQRHPWYREYMIPANKIENKQPKSPQTQSAVTQTP